MKLLGFFQKWRQPRDKFSLETHQGQVTVRAKTNHRISAETSQERSIFFRISKKNRQIPQEEPTDSPNSTLSTPNQATTSYGKVRK